MASREEVAKTLAALQALFPRELTELVVQAYALGLEDVSDEALRVALARVVKTSVYFPKIAELRQASGINQRPDPEAILAAIWSLSSYHPHTGTTAPSVGLVKDQMGETIAAAYALASADRLFGGNQTGRDIARREFAKDLEAAAEQGFPVALPPVVSRPMLAASNTTIYNERPVSGFQRQIRAIMDGLNGGARE
jgi:hypothetical protein